MAMRRWTDDELDAVRAMRARGLTFTQISRKLGDRSRNSIASIVYRGRV